MAGAVRRPPVGGSAPLILIEHFEALDALLVVDAEGIALVDPDALDATDVGRALDPLTPLARVDRLPAGVRVADAAAAARWTVAAEVLTGALCAGLAAATCTMAVEYAKGRQQFGRPIGSFQAVKHLCADMLVRAEVARAAVEAAALSVDQSGVGDPERAAAGAALLAGEAAVANAKACIQVHGGMGFTWEVPAHLYLMRARVLVSSLPRPAALAATVAARY